MPRSGSSLRPSSARRRASSGARRRTRRPPGSTPSVAMPLRTHSFMTPPDLEQPVADLLLGAPRQLVLEHDAARSTCPSPCSAASSSSPVRKGCATGVESSTILVSPVGVLADDEAAADGVVRVLRHGPPVGVERRERHAVGVQRQRLAAVQHEVLVLDEVDLVLAEQREPLASRGSRRGAPRPPAGRTARAARPSGRGGRPCRCRARGPVAPSEPKSCERTRATRSRTPSSRSRSAKSAAARIGPTVCELDGPMPIEKRSKTLSAMVS